MADRFWVGGAGTWNTTSTTNWSASSGGASGASVPTVADSVFFDQAGTYTVTMTGALACLDITVSAGTVTFAQGTSPSLNVRGSMSLLAGTVWSSTATITFSSTATGRTVTTNGTSIAGGVIFNGVGGGWTLGSALTITAASGSFAVLAGTFDTSSVGNYSVTCGTFTSNGTLTRTLNLNASIITFGVGVVGSIFDMTNTGITFNVGTSTFTTNQSGSNFILAGLNYWNFSFGNSTTGGIRSITGANTFNNFTVAAASNIGVSTVTFNAPQTINGTLSTTNTAGNKRVFFASANYGIAQTLIVNSTPNLTDCDFREIYVLGTAAPVSGTRIGNRGGCRGITFSAPKTVYWNLAGTQGWGNNGWAATSGGSPNTDNFPLPQDTAVVNNAAAITTLTTDFTTYVPNVDFSARTSAFTFSTAPIGITCYGNWANGSGVSFAGTNGITFSGGTTQTITSAGKTFSCPITVDTYGGTVQLADALNIGSNALTVTNGTFTTAGYAVTASSLNSSNSNVRTINLNASTVTTSSSGNFVDFTTSTNLTFNAGTSTIITANTTATLVGGNQTFYNVSFTGVAAGNSNTISGNNTFNNLSFTSVGGLPGLYTKVFSGNQTVNGTLTCTVTSPVNRIFLRSDTINTPRTLTVNSLSAEDCDFRDINLAGAASGVSPTRAGDCGGNMGITFPTPKTVYWNLSGAQNWSAIAWATSSGGTPAINNFPLAQDTAVFDNTGSVTGVIQIQDGWNIGTFDASLRTSAMTLASPVGPFVYGDWKFGTGVTLSSTTGTITFAKPGTQTITSNGVQFGCPIDIDHPLCTVQLADALSLNSLRALRLRAGTFDAVTYNVTIGGASNISSANTWIMGSGTWTLSGTGDVWTFNTSPTVIAGTSNIILSDTSTNSRRFLGGDRYYNKLTIGGTTGSSTLTITGTNTFGELASTKTVAHQILFPSSNTTMIGKWSVTGTAGNVVSVGPSTGATSYFLSIAGPATSGIDYLSVSFCIVNSGSPGEFYVGANSTSAGSNTGVIFAATPAPRTLYWVGGGGNWSSTTKWSTSSGGTSGAAIPTSLDAVIFNSASSATAYTATIDAGVTLARCASFTMAGPASGNVTFAGTVPIAFHGNVSFAATGITRTYSGAMLCAGNGSYTFTTNGLTLASACTVIGVGSTWTLGSAINTSSFTFTYGSFSTSASNYSVTSGGTFASNNSNVRSVSLNGSTLSLGTLSATAVDFRTTTNFTFNPGTSLINQTGSTAGIGSGGLTFNNVSFTSTSASSVTITGANTFNTLSFAGRTTVGINAVTFNADQTIGTLTLNPGTASAYRTFLASNTMGTPRTLAVTALTAGAADIDFRDIAITGTAAPVSGTRFGDCKGNSGITFPAAKTVYYRGATSTNWGATTSWSFTNGGAADSTAFPLAQDNARVWDDYPNSTSTITINANYNIGTIDLSGRTNVTMTLATGTTTPVIYGNWLNGTGITLTGIGVVTFAGRGAQTITSAGKIFTQPFSINTPSGSVTLQDALSCDRASTSTLSLVAGTFDANGYNVTYTNGGFATTGSEIKTYAIGSGTWIAGAAGSSWSITGINLTITGTGTISLTSASAKTFGGGNTSYSGITLNQGGAGTLTITGNNIFKDITNTYSATGATTIAFGATIQRVNTFTGSGSVGKVLTITGTSAASPATLILTGTSKPNVNYLNIVGIRSYSLTETWYAGLNSTNAGSLGWYFTVDPNAPTSQVYYGSVNITGIYYGSTPVSAIYYGSTKVF